MKMKKTAKFTNKRRLRYSELLRRRREKEVKKVIIDQVADTVKQQQITLMGIDPAVLQKAKERGEARKAKEKKAAEE